RPSRGAPRGRALRCRSQGWAEAGAPARRPSARCAVAPEGADLALHPLELLLERDHLQLAADDDLLELLQVEDLLLKLRLRLLEVLHDLFIGAHVTEDADRANYFPV